MVSSCWKSWKNTGVSSEAFTRGILERIPKGAHDEIIWRNTRNSEEIPGKIPRENPKEIPGRIPEQITKDIYGGISEKKQAESQKKSKKYFLKKMRKFQEIYLE